MVRKLFLNSISMKKQLILLGMSLLAVLSAQAQGELKNQSVAVEIGGPSNMIGVSYEHRLRDHRQWGWRTGLGFIYTESSDFLSGDNDLRGWAVPLELNYLTGHRKNHLELGLGLNLGYYNEHESYIYYEYTGQAPDGTYLYTGEQRNNTVNTWGYYFYGNVGYRHQSANGFQFRAGINPSFNLGGSHAVSKGFFWPYVSFGWAF